MPPPEDRSNGRTSPHGSRRSDSRSSSNAHRTSKDDRRSEERRPDDRSRFGRLENSSPTQNHSSTRIPSGPRALNPISRSTPANSPSVTTSTKHRLDSQSDAGPDQVRSPKRSAGESAVPDPISSQYLRPDMVKEVQACFREFGGQIRDYTALSFEREKAKQSYDQKSDGYERYLSSHATHPEIEEYQVAIRAKAKEDFESVEKRLAEKNVELEKSYESMAIKMISGGVDISMFSREQQMIRDKLSDFEKRFATQDGEIKKMKDEFSTLHRDCELRAKELCSIREELSAVRATADAMGANNIQREEQKTAISALQSKVDGELAKLREETANISKTLRQNFEDRYASPLRSLEQRFELVDQDAKRKEPQREQDHELIKKLGKSQEQSSETLKSIGSDTAKLSTRMTAMEKTTTEIQTVVNKRETVAKSQVGEYKSLVEDITGIRRRVDILESKPSGPQPSSPTAGRSTPAKGTAKGTPKEAHEVEIDEPLSKKVDSIKYDFEQLQAIISQRFDRFQEDNDDVYGNNIDELKSGVSELNAKFKSSKSDIEALVSRQSILTDKIETVEASLNTLKERHNGDLQGLAHQTSQWTNQSTKLENLHREVQALKAASRPAELVSNYAQNTPGFARQTGSPVISNAPALGRQSGSPVVNAPDHLYSKQVNRVDAIEMGLNHLNTRFNNLTTDGLARQMWSQLDNVHPHLKDATRGFSKLELAIQAHDGQFVQLHQRVDALEKRGSLPPPGLEEALERVDQNVTAQRVRTDTLEITTESIQKQVDEIREDLAAGSHPAAQNLSTRSNGASTHEGSAIDNGTVKRKTSDAANGNSKRLKRSRRAAKDSDDDIENQGNGLSNDLSPP